MAALSHGVGQPYRAAILTGGGPFGQLPVGVAAAQQDEDLGEEDVMEEMALEVGLDSSQQLHLITPCLLRIPM